MSTLLYVEHSPGLIALRGELTAAVITEARDFLLEELQKHSTLELDFAHVTQIDDRGAELLVRLQHEALLAQKSLMLGGFTEGVSATLDGMQLGRALSASTARSWS